MKRIWTIAAAAVSLAVPAALAAQRPPRPPKPPRVWSYSFSTDNRGRIGVVVKTEADPESDKLGARIEGVTPGGPAEQAGLKVGDIITKFSGTSLAGVKSEDEEESGPGRKLIELAHALDPGDTVQIEYRRGSDTKKATLVAEDLGSAWRWEMPEPRIFMPPHEPGTAFEFSFGMPWGDLELVTLNPDLGEYFGTKEGILVVKAPADSGLPLKGGDVLLSIGGRKPSSPAHAVRILRSYDEGETVSIDVMRRQKRMTVTWKVQKPEDRPHRFMRRFRDQDHFDPDPDPGSDRT